VKEQSIRGFHYEPLYKIGLHFRSRFWEHTSRPSFGGQSTTDLRFHWIVYPSNDLEHRGSGVLLLYCWMTDASSWNSMSKEERVQLALHDLDRFFRNDGVDVYKQYIEAWDISWSCEGATGDAQFLPGQFSRFHEIANRLEGNIHFAGEHLSKHHTWISGALDSALTTTRNMLGNQDLAPIGRERTSVARVRPLRETDIPSH
jgi:monoamine oxidase